MEDTKNPDQNKPGKVFFEDSDYKQPSKSMQDAFESKEAPKNNPKPCKSDPTLPKPKKPSS